MKGSHDSLSSYKARKWWFIPLLPFARTQTKTIEEQLDAGVRYFDLRFSDVGGTLYAAHGICQFDITIDEVFAKLSKWCNENDEKVYFRCLYETKCDDMKFLSFKAKVNNLIVFSSKNLIVHCIGRKKEWSKHVYFNKVEFLGANDYTFATLDEKIEETKKRILEAEPYIYQCYSYKMLIPYLAHYVLREYIPSNSMSDFV